MFDGRRTYSNISARDQLMPDGRMSTPLSDNDQSGEPLRGHDMVLFFFCSRWVRVLKHDLCQALFDYLGWSETSENITIRKLEPEALRLRLTHAPTHVHVYICVIRPMSLEILFQGKRQTAYT